MSDSTRRSRYVVSIAVALLCFVCLTFEARAAWRAAGNVVSVVRQTDGATLALSSGARVSITFVSPDAIRVRLAPRGVFERDLSYAVEEKPREGMRATVREAGRDVIEISGGAGRMKVVVQRRPFLVSVYDAQGQLVAQDDPARPASFDVETGAVETSKRRDATEDLFRVRREGAARRAPWPDDGHVELRHLRLSARSRPDLSIHPLLHRAPAGARLRHLFRQHAPLLFRHGQHGARALHVWRGGRRVELLRLDGRRRAHAEKRRPRLHSVDGADAAAARVVARLSTVALLLLSRIKSPRHRAQLPRATHPRRRALLRHRLHGRLPRLYVGQKLFPRPAQTFARPAPRRFQHRRHHRPRHQG